MKKRLVSILLAFCMVLSLLPGTVWAEEPGNTFEPENTTQFDETEKSGTVIASGVFGANTEPNLQWRIEADPSGNILIISGTGLMAQYGTRIGPWNDYGDSIKKIVIEEGVTNIALSIFDECAATSISIPSTTDELDGWWSSTGYWYERNLFEGCEMLQEILVDPRNAAFTSVDGVLFSKDMTNLLSYPRGRISSSYTIPSGVTHIGNHSFALCDNLSNVVIPNSVTEIGTYAFYMCHGLTALNLPDSITSIGNDAFHECNRITNLKISNGLTRLVSNVFASCSGLTSVEIPSSVTTIDHTALVGCKNMVSLYIPSSVVFIENGGFLAGCDSLKDIFYGGNQDQWLAIKGPTGNPSVTVPSVELHTTENGQYYIVSENPDRLAEIHYNSTGGGQGGSGEDPSPIKPTWSYDEATKTLTISGRGSISNYTENTHAPWSQYKDTATSIVIEDGITSIGDYAFEFFSKVTDVKMPNGLTRIGKCAFQTCGSLGNVTIPEGVTTIGEEAFGGCINLKSAALPYSIKNVEEFAFQILHDLDDVYYNGNIIEWKNINILSGNTPLLNAKTIHYNSVGPNECKVYYGSGKDPEIFRFSLEECIGQTRSIEYSPQLSHMLIALSNAAYDERNIEASMNELGFSGSNLLLHYIPGDWSDVIAYSIGKKTMTNGKQLVLIAIRGSSTSLDWLSNFTVGAALGGCAWHDGFESAANEIYGDLVNFIGDFSNAIFVVTGHSRGAATANLLEVMLSNAGAAQENVYGYNFACPDVATIVSGAFNGWNWMGEHDNIFNIGNSPDIVSVAPGVLGSIFASGVPVVSSWGKFGQSRWFSNDWNSIYETALDITFAAHSQEVYLQYLGQEPRPSFSSFKTWGQRTVAMTVLAPIQSIGKQFGVFCPVDVIIEDDSGTPIASVIDNEVNYYNSKFGEVIIFTDGDRKSIYVQGSKPLTLRLTATDSGTMEYIVQTVDLDLGEVLSEKSFAEVSLTPNKQMLSLTDVEAVTGVGEDVSRVPLYVLNGVSSQPEFKVLPDDKGTEVPLNTPVITFDAAVDSISILPMAVGDDGMLSELPVPTRSGYAFNGWYMPDGTKVDTNTVFSTDTTVKAQWTKNSTGGDSPSNPGGSTTTPTVPSGPSYNPGGTYTPPTHSITTPSITGGKVSVNPSSASSGSTVTVTATPDTGYELASLTVSDSTGKALELTTRGNGQYSFKMPNGKVSLSVEFRLANTNTSWNNPFVDVSIGDWYYDAVRFVSENGLMNGVGNGYFSPNMNLSRAMFAQILYNKAGQPSAVDSSAFNDVPIGAWYTDAVTWAAANDIVGGYGDGMFGPDDPITREQLAVMLWRYAGKPVPPNLLLNFTDADCVSGYALDALCWAVDQGIINGKGNGILDPQGFATRAEVAQISKNYQKK